MNQRFYTEVLWASVLGFWLSKILSKESVKLKAKLYFNAIITLQTQHVDSTLKRRGNDRFHVVSRWNPRGVFVLLPLLNVAGYWKSSNTEACVKTLSQIIANSIDNGGGGLVSKFMWGIVSLIILLRNSKKGAITWKITRPFKSEATN